jgi:hypothetical protein
MVIFGSEREGVIRGGDKYTAKSFMISVLSKILLG